MVSLTLIGCSAGSDGALSVKEAVDRQPAEVVRVHGAVVIQYGKPMICAELTESSPPQCAAGLWLRGSPRQLEDQEFHRDQGVQWTESATVRGTVDGDGFFTLAP
jgi:hypothetical protein